MQIDPNKNLVISVSIDMTNAILKALSAQPYEQVAGIIATIQQQASSQLQPAQKEVAAEAPQEPVAAE